MRARRRLAGLGLALLVGPAFAQGAGIVSPDAPVPDSPQPEIQLPSTPGKPLPALAPGVEDKLTREAALMERPLRIGLPRKTLAAGTTVRIQQSLRNADGGWCYVEGDDGNGWVSALALPQCKP